MNKPLGQFIILVAMSVDMCVWMSVCPLAVTFYWRVMTTYLINLHPPPQKKKVFWELQR